MRLYSFDFAEDAFCISHGNYPQVELLVKYEKSGMGCNIVFPALVAFNKGMTIKQMENRKYFGKEKYDDSVPSLFFLEIKILNKYKTLR